MIEFNLILKAAGKPVIDAMFWGLLIDTIIVLGFGFAGEAGGINALVGFVFGMTGWAYLLYKRLPKGRTTTILGSNSTESILSQFYSAKKNFLEMFYLNHSEEECK